MKYPNKNIVLIAFWGVLAGFCSPVSGQNFTVDLVFSEDFREDQQQRIRRQLNVRDTATLRKRVYRTVDNLREEGYAEAAIDRYQWQKDSLSLALFRGPYYQLEQLEISEAPAALKAETRLALPRPFSRSMLRKHLNEALQKYQAQGYPFAAFSYPELSLRPLESDSLAASLRYSFELGDQVRIDSIRFQGSRREPDYLLYRLIRLKPGDYYQQALVDDIPRILNNTPYYERTPLPQVRYKQNGKAVLDIKLRRQRAGKFDLLLGILPPDDPNESRIRITGLVDAVFVSALEMGERIDFHFRQFSATSQILRLGYEQPFIAGLPITPIFQFNLQKQEERFLNRSLYLAGRYAFSPQLQGELFYRNRQTALLDTSLASGPGGEALPEVMSGSDRRVGLRLHYDNLDYRLNPRKGAFGSFEVGIGQRSSRPDARLGDAARAVLQESQPVQEVDLRVSVYIPLGKRTTLRLANESYLLVQDQLFQNDQRQLGGGRSIRGFEDNRFFADRLTFFTAEYRILLDRQAHFLGFVDYAYLENQVEKTALRPWSFGLGLQIDTGAAGLLSLTYGVGQLEENGFRPARGKLHIGLVNNF